MQLFVNYWKHCTLEWDGNTLTSSLKMKVRLENVGEIIPTSEWLYYDNKQERRGRQQLA